MKKRLVVTLCVGLGLFLLFFKNEISAFLWPSYILENEEQAPAQIKKIVEQLNLKAKDGLRYRIYTAGFFDDDNIPYILEEDKNTKKIMWLGGRKVSLNSQIKHFDYIFVTYPDLVDELKEYGIKSFYVPLFVEESKPIALDNQVIVIGHPLLVEQMLDKYLLPYEQYDWKMVYDKPNLIEKAGVIFVENPLQVIKRYDVPQVLLKAAISGIPMVGHWEGGGTKSVLYTFNDNIFFYMYDDDLSYLVKQIKEKQIKEIKIKALQNKKFVKREFSLERIVQKISHIILGKDEQNIYDNKGGITLNISSMVGAYGAGDYWVAKDIENYLKEENKYHVDLSFSNSTYDYPNDVYIRMRGQIMPDDAKAQGKVNILYQIYPDRFSPSEEVYWQNLYQAMQGNDAFISASEKIAKVMAEKGINSFYLPQFTNPQRFFYEYDENLATQVLFVGNYHFNRQGILWAWEEGVPITIYGDMYPKGVAKKKYVDNRELHKYYSSAKIVLNDTLPIMRHFGFISNRIFDATATGTLVISDYMPEIEKIYGDAVPMYKSKEELIFLVRYYLTHEKERLYLAKKAQQITLQKYTIQKAMRSLNQIVEKINKEK